MFNPDNDKSVFVFGHYGKRLETMDKDRFKLLAQMNPHISFSRIYNQNMHVLILSLETAIFDNDIEMINTILECIEYENYLDIVFRQANKLMLGLGDSVSFGSLVAGQFKPSQQNVKMVKRREIKP